MPDLEPSFIHELQPVVPKDTGQVGPADENCLRPILSIHTLGVPVHINQNACLILAERALEQLEILRRRIVIQKEAAAFADKVDHILRVRVSQAPLMALDVNGAQADLAVYDLVLVFWVRALTQTAVALEQALQRVVPMVDYVGVLEANLGVVRLL